MKDAHARRSPAKVQPAAPAGAAAAQGETLAERRKIDAELRAEIAALRARIEALESREGAAPRLKAVPGSLIA